MTEFLARYMDPEIAGWASFALLAVLGLLALFVVVRAFGGARERRRRAETARLSIVDVEEVDGRRRLVLIRRDRVEHLVMIGGPSDIVIEAGIGAEPSRSVAPRPQRSAEPRPMPQPTAQKPTPAPLRDETKLAPAPARSEPSVAPPPPEPRDAVTTSLEPIRETSSADQEPARPPTLQVVPPPARDAASAPPPVKPEPPKAAQPARVEPVVVAPADIGRASDDGRKEELDSEIRDLLAQMGRGPDARPIDKG